MIAINVVAKGRQNLRIVSTGCDNRISPSLCCYEVGGGNSIVAACKFMQKKILKMSILDTAGDLIISFNF